MTVTDVPSPTHEAKSRAEASPAAYDRAERNPARRLSQLDALEAESIHVIREIAAELERPALLFSGGKDSVVMLHLATKAFWPAPIPFPVLHVDTGHNFPEVLAYRDETVERLGLRLEVASVQDYIDDGRLRERADGTRNPLQTHAAARRDRRAPLRRRLRRRPPRRGEGPRQGAHRQPARRVRPVGPANQRPELWNLYNGRGTGRASTCASSRSSNWTELDVWRYIEREDIALPPLYYAHEREVFDRDGMWLAVGAVLASRATARPSSAASCATAPSAT